MKKKIPLFKPNLNKDIYDSLDKVMSSGWLSSGEMSRELELYCKDIIGSQYCISVSSCTTAIEIILQYLDLNEEDEIIIPTWTFVSVAHVSERTKAKIVFVDCDEENFNLNIRDLKRKINDKTKVIIFPEFGGLISDVSEVRNIIIDKDIYVIEDCAHSLGAKYNQENAGNLFNAGAFSFYANKMIGGAEGGLIATNDKSLYEFAMEYRINGMTKSAINRYKIDGTFQYEVNIKGIKGNLSDIHAALVVPQLKDISNIISKRKVLADNYKILFSECDKIKLPIYDEGRVWWNFQIVIQSDLFERDELMMFLKEKGIGTSIHFRPIHTFNAYFNPKITLPISEKYQNKVLSLPFYIGLSIEEQEYVAKNIIKFLEAN